MSPRQLLLITIAAGCSFVAVNASAADDLRKPTVKRGVPAKKVVQSVKEKPVAKVAPRVFRRSADQPCDSCACRPFRFAWSPVAPGA